MPYIEPVLSIRATRVNFLFPSGGLTTHIRYRIFRCPFSPVRNHYRFNFAPWNIRTRTYSLGDFVLFKSHSSEHTVIVFVAIQSWLFLNSHSNILYKHPPADVNISFPRITIFLWHFCARSFPSLHLHRKYNGPNFPNFTSKTGPVLVSEFPPPRKKRNRCVITTTSPRWNSSQFRPFCKPTLPN